MKIKKVVSGLLALSIAVGSMYVVSAKDQYVTRGQVADMLLVAADDYNPNVKKEDIIQGYEDGELHEDWNVTRAEALVMLKRAFGKMPELNEYTKRIAIPKEDFTDIPKWAETELADVFDAGIVAGTSEGVFSPDENVTDTQMDLFIKRTYAVFGSNLKDDFYATVNKEALNNFEIKPGRLIAGNAYSLDDTNTERINDLLANIINQSHEKGTKEQKIADLYNNITDTESRNKAGITPIKPYLDKIDEVKTIKDLNEINSELIKELCISALGDFSVTADFKDNTKNIPDFYMIAPILPKDIYMSDNAEQIKAYKDYLTENLVLSGETKESAQKHSEAYFDFEKQLAESMLDTQDNADVDKIYNLYTLEELQKAVPNMDISKILKDSEFKYDGKILVSDVGLLEKNGELYNKDNIDVLKTRAKLIVLLGWGETLNEEFTQVSTDFQNAFYGTEGSYTAEEKATITIENIMYDYLGELYAQNYFSKEAKQNVEKMISDIIDVYRTRIEKLTWMSDTTKEKALKKLDTMQINVGYPEDVQSYMDDVEIKSAADGGSYFENMLAISKEQVKNLIEHQDEPIDKNDWGMAVYTVNAMYDSLANSITFPAGILQAPIYDVNASYEENLGGIGYIIAHEITHAFDNNGAKFDENGNATDWWTEEDYSAFSKLCKDVEAFYDGEEAAPGIAVNGELTLSENIADLGAVSCITEIVSHLDNPNYEALYKSIARTWASSSSREYMQYVSQTNVHCLDKLRTNRTIVNDQEFYDTFGIKENDGMYVAPEDRVHIW